MKPALHGSKSVGAPAVLRFEAQLTQLSAAPPAGSQLVLQLPPVVSRKLAGMTKVEGTINGHPFRAALDSTSAGGHSLRVSRAMCKGAAAQPGDTVALAILGPQPEPELPADLSAALGASAEARRLWGELSPLGRLDWIRWVELAVKPETRKRRVTRTVEQLAEGKRRPCCVNVNEYMLCRVRETEQEE